MQNDIFGGAIPVKKRSVSWHLTDHVCIHCFGRLLKRRVSPTVNEVMCSECEARSFGNEAALCWCGKKLNSHGFIFECIVNQNKRPELPNVIMVQEKKIIPEPPQQRMDRRVYCPDSFT